jgi:hypothetical protein
MKFAGHKRGCSRPRGQIRCPAKAKMDNYHWDTTSVEVG